MVSLAIIMVMCCICFTHVTGKCPPDDPSEAANYVPILPESSYDGNYSSISSVGKHPLGFYKGTWFYNQEDQVNPCVHVSGASNRRVEIMFETHPAARLCVKDQASQVECSDAGTGRFYACRHSPGDDVYFEFFCDQGEEYDVRFWYRLVLGDKDPEDEWCDNRQAVEYPSDLMQLPPNFPVQDNTTPSPDSGLSLHPHKLLFVSFTAFVIALIQ